MTNLETYRTRVLNTLKSTNEKFENDIVDEAIRRVLDEYSQAFPDITEYDFPLVMSGRTQLLNYCTSLLAVLQIILPYDTALLDPSSNAREDFYVFFNEGQPFVHFTGSPVPLQGQVMFVRFACRHTLAGLDGKTFTSMRADHASMLVVGAAGAAAMSRAAGTIEQWGGKAGDPNQLMLWGQTQYERFREFLLTIRSEQTQAIFPSSFWALDGEDQADEW